MTERRRATPRHPSGARNRVRAWAVLFAMALAWSPGGTAQDVAPEYQLKAAFISKFPEFTEWPSAVLDRRGALAICVVSPSPLGAALAEFTAGEALRGRPMQVREVGAATDVDTCHVLFVPRQSEAGGKALLARARTRPILTIGESPAFLDEGGIVKLNLVAGRLRFEVNAGAASRVGLKLSSQLLRLALDVRSGPS